MFGRPEFGQSARLIRPAFGPWLIILVVSIYAWPLVVYGPQTGDDLWLQLPWSHQFSTQVLAGDLYPRWLVNINRGAGGPTFFFYGPVAYYAVTLVALICQGCSAITQLGITQYCLLLASATTMYAYSKHHSAGWGASIAAIVYTLAPYHFSFDVLQRQALAELAAYVWIPLVFLYSDRVADRQAGAVGLSLSYCLLIMTHLPTALLCSPFFALYLLCYCFHTRNIRSLVIAGGAVAAGILMAGVYLIPALALQKDIHSQLWWTPYFDYHRWFLLDGTSAPNAIIKQVSTAAILNSVLFASSFMAFLTLRRPGDMSRVGTLVAIFIGTWFVITPLSNWFWENLPLVRKVQFPWRMIVLQDFVVAAAVALALVRVETSRFTRIILGLCIAVYLCTAGWFTLQKWEEHSTLWHDIKHSASQEALATSGSDASQHIPVSVKLPRKLFLRSLPKEKTLQSHDLGQIRIIVWRPRKIVLEVSTPKAMTAMVRQIYFPGWRGMIENGTRLELRAHGRLGLIQVPLPPGNYRVKLVLESTLPEKAGWWSLLAGLLLISFMAIVEARTRIKEG